MSDALRSSLPSLHDDFPCHLRMQAAEIIVGAGIGECEGKRVVILKRRRPAALVLVDDIVRNVVMIVPLDRRPCGNSQSRRTEGEVINRHLGWLLCGNRAV